MSEQTVAAPTRQAAAAEPKPGLMLQRKCACGQHTVAGGECEECRKKRLAMQKWPSDRPRPEPWGRQAEGAATRGLGARSGIDLSRVPAQTATLRTAPRIQRMAAGSAVGDLAAPASEPAPESAAPTPGNAPPTEESVPGSEPEAGPASEPESTGDAPAGTALLVEDGAGARQPGQMAKEEFLAQLQSAVCAEAEAALAGTGRTTDGCPYLAFWFGFYRGQSADYMERALRRYVPEATGAAAAADYIPLVAARVRQGVERWATTGEITGVPDDAPMPVGAPAPGSTESDAGEVRLSPRGAGRRSDDPAAVRDRLGAGRPMDYAVRNRMESAFGHSFVGVRVHTDSRAGRISSEQDARAFTVGEHVAFGAGEYRPGSAVGDALIAHELAHVVQQESGATHGSAGTQGYNALEHDADRAATGVVAALWGGASRTAADVAQNAAPRMRSGLQLQRCKSDSKEETPAAPEAAAAKCCDYDSFTASADTYHGPPDECMKTIKFTFKVKPGADPHKCVMVNWIKGSAKKKDGTPYKVKMFDNIVDYDFPSTRIDSMDADPVYWSNSSSRWNYKAGGTNEYWATDAPKPPGGTWEDGADFNLTFKMCLHCIDDVSATSDETGSGVKNPLKCIPWEFKAKYDAAAGKCSH